ncbi:MAG: aldo/keto reductase [Clostridiales bacterium]|nr:aldo/keto reductase [Clostridiales bacterium]
MRSITDTFTLRNGYKMPCLGYGTWQTPDGQVAVDSVKEALRVGYRHIDGAAAYHNEECVGRGIKESGVAREDIFITSKLWNDERGYDTTLRAFDKTLADLGLEYLDLYLIHWPASSSRFDNWEQLNLDTWRAMTELYKAGRIRAIGVSNFHEHHLRALMETEVLPMVNQIEFHPGQMSAELVSYCKANDIILQAWSPLGQGSLIGHETITAMAEKYGKTPAQMILRWVLQNGVVPLSKSITPSRITENAQIFDFEISEDDMAVISAMPYVGGSGQHPDEVKF